VQESPHALHGWRARPERRRTVHEGRLHLSPLLVQKRVGQPGSIAETSVQRPHPHPRGLRDVVHQKPLDALLGHYPLGGLQEPAPVPSGIGPLRVRLTQNRQRLARNVVNPTFYGVLRSRISHVSGLYRNLFRLRR
jgi:hypothetical protein